MPNFSARFRVRSRPNRQPASCASISPISSKGKRVLSSMMRSTSSIGSPFEIGLQIRRHISYCWANRPECAGSRRDQAGRWTVTASVRILALVASLLAAPALIVTPAAAQMPAALQKIIDGAKAEGALSLQYGGGILGTAEGAQVAADGIKKMFGVDLKATYAPGPSFAPMASRLYTELQ